jgi:nifR3 family TIM-barrel protein
MSIFLKDVELKSNLILAPMAGFTDVAFRHKCLEYGAGLVCTEMVSSKALHYKNQKTEELLASFDSDRPTAVQIFGHEPEIMAEAVRNPLLQKFDVIDINMGCPARKIISNSDGSALLNDIELSRQIIEACVKATNKPVTVKFRIGYHDDKIVAVEFAKMCEEAGVAAITVHGRTTSQGYAGKVDYETIRKVKESVLIPVFANGDCRTKEDYENILKITGADGIAIGRGAVGKPEVFSQMLGLDYEVDKLEQIKYHYETLMEFFPEKYVVKYMRSHLAGYLSGKYKNSAALVSLLKMEKYSEIVEFLSKIIV